MVLASVTFRLPDDREVVCGPGDLIGRMPGATVTWPDPTLSEARALVSLRGGRLWLLGLRGALQTRDGTPRDVELEERLRIRLSAELVLEVVEVALPGEVWCLCVPEPLPLLHERASLVFEPAPALIPGLRDDAVAVVWSAGEVTWLRARDSAPMQIQAGVSLVLAGRNVTVQRQPLRQTTRRRTPAPTWTFAPLRLTVEEGRVVVRGEGREAILDGKAGELVCEFVDMRDHAAQDWRDIAANVWPDKDPEAKELRTSFDKARGRVETLLWAAGLRPDLIRSDNAGRWRLHLREGDAVEERARRR